MLRPALILATALAIASSAQAAGKPPKADLTAARTEHDRVVGMTRPMIDGGKLNQAKGLSWTRTVLERPHSDWGIYGVGDVFKEKKLALVNLRRAKSNVAYMRQHLDTATSGSRLSWGQKRWVSGARAELTALDAEIDEARDSLRATSRIWSHQKLLFTMSGVGGREYQQFEAFFVDGPAHQTTVDAMVEAFDRGAR